MGQLYPRVILPAFLERAHLILIIVLGGGCRDCLWFQRGSWGTTELASLPKVTDSKQQSWNLNSGNWLSDPVLIARMHQIRAAWGMNALSRQLWASQVALVVKNPPANAGDGRDVSSIPGSGRSPGEGCGNPPQYSCLENPTDRRDWWTTVHRIWKRWTWLSDRACMHTGNSEDPP